MNVALGVGGTIVVCFLIVCATILILLGLLLHVYKTVELEAKKQRKESVDKAKERQ